MTASVTIVTEEETGLAVPAEAFSFTPDESVMKALRKPEKPEGDPEASQGGQPKMNGKAMSGGNMVWVKKGGSIMPCPVKVGTSDGAYKIIEEGVQAGDSVVLSAQYVVREKAKKTGDNPFMPSPPKNKNNNNKGGGGPPM